MEANNNIDAVGLAEDGVVNDGGLREIRMECQTRRFDELPVEIRIYKVVTPSIFYFHLSSSYRELMGLEREMADYYEDNPSMKDPLCKKNEVIPFEFYGLYSKSKRRWVRVLVDDDERGFRAAKNGFTVVLVDYAEREYVRNEMLRYLPQVFCELRAQGYQAQLYLEDGDMNKTWSESEACSFREKVLHRNLAITPVGFNMDRPYMPEFSVFIHLDAPCCNSMYLGGIYPYGTENLPIQRANIEVIRVRKNIWSKRFI